MQIKRKTIPHKYRNKYLRNSTPINYVNEEIGTVSFRSLQNNDPERLIVLPDSEFSSTIKQGYLYVDVDGFVKFKEA